MAAPQDKDYVTACGKLASALSISISSARRKVDLVAAKEGIRDNAGRLLVAQRLVLEAQGVAQESRQLLDVLLEAVKEEENYLGDD
ncbi:hypothetical protein [Vulcanococcus sp.]|jgi:hypothetical protein|uniref:hypothetical protein n=1 Tax=Vulcanococcus sp. TaxID=2856995 RepID=UPI0032343328